MVESLVGSQTSPEPKSSFVDVDGVHLHYLEWDPEHLAPSEQQGHTQVADEIPLVMLHGLGTTAEVWRLVAPYLYHHHRVIAFDIRGHGLSDQPEDGYDFATISEDIVHGMAILGLGQVALIGHGWGARIALNLTALHPALISHLILVDCPFVEPRHWPDMTRERFLQESEHAQTYTSPASYLEAMQKEMAAFWSRAVETIVLSFVRELPDGTVEERLRPDIQRQIRQAIWDEQALSFYSKISCPVLLIPAAGQPDPSGKPPEKLEQAKEFALAKGFMTAQVARTIRNCTVLWMPDTSHDIHLHRPRRLAAAIADFVRE